MTIVSNYVIYIVEGVVAEEIAICELAGTRVVESSCNG
jgi:hypothetical protein